VITISHGQSFENMGHLSRAMFNLIAECCALCIKDLRLAYISLEVRDKDPHSQTHTAHPTLFVLDMFDGLGHVFRERLRVEARGRQDVP